MPIIIFIGLNPGTAGATEDDQTVGRCRGLTKDWEYGGFQIVDLFAYCSTDPSALEHADDPVGPENDQYIKEATGLDAALVIATWGEKGGKTDRSNDVLNMINRGIECLGYAKDGFPRHPSRVEVDAKLVSYPQEPRPCIVMAASRLLGYESSSESEGVSPIAL